MIISGQHISASSHNFKRIISLVPSITELLSDLNLDEKVIGITKFCVHPADWFKNKPRVGGTKNVNIKMIHALAPDLIIANKEENVKEQVEELSNNYNVFVTDVKDIKDAFSMIASIGKLTNRKAMSSTIIEDIKARFQILKNNCKPKRKLKSAYFIWRNPYMVAGGNTFINDMMQYCGLQNIFSSIYRYPEITLNDIRLLECEIVLLSSEPYPFKEKHSQEIKSELPGVKIVLTDGEMFSWYGSRLLKAADYFEFFNSKLIAE
ncbi:MAG: helical backbone metal receptor [Ginsengibacter sp.]